MRSVRRVNLTATGRSAWQSRCEQILWIDCMMTNVNFMLHKHMIAASCVVTERRALCKLLAIGKLGRCDWRTGELPNERNSFYKPLFASKCDAQGFSVNMMTKSHTIVTCILILFTSFGCAATAWACWCGLLMASQGDAWEARDSGEPLWNNRKQICELLFLQAATHLSIIQKWSRCFCSYKPYHN